MITPERSLALALVLSVVGCVAEDQASSEAGDATLVPGSPAIGEVPLPARATPESESPVVGRTDLALTFQAPVTGLADTLPGTPWTEADWAVFSEAVREASRAGVADAPLGEAIGAIGRGFVGFPYTPQTLESPWIDGRNIETLVVNLREFDCVTFVENVLALAWFVRNEGEAALDDPGAARGVYEDYLQSLRYRGGALDGYSSRLHYFSEWLSDNAGRGRLQLLSVELDARPDSTAIDFMSTHVSAYPALAGDAGEVARIREAEATLAAELPRWFVPEAGVAAIADRIRTGDVIAATSTVAGLDIAHTGIALRVEGELRLMHAPLVGSEVQISEVSLAERLLRIEGQDGVMVARPLPVSGGGPSGVGIPRMLP